MENNTVLLKKISYFFNLSDHIDGRVRPDTSYQNNGQPYVITPARLAQIRGNFMYWFYDQGGSDNLGDYQRDIHTSTPQIHKNFNFQLPFFGFRFNYTRVSYRLNENPFWDTQKTYNFEEF